MPYGTHWTPRANGAWQGFSEKAEPWPVPTLTFEKRAQMSSASNPTRWVAVDDDDPSITYTGDWYVTSEQFPVFGAYNRYGPPHYGSQHATNTSGSLSFPFRGSRVVVYGTSHQVNTTSLVDPIWDCLVDGVSYGHEEGWSRYTINQWPICVIDLDSAGQHTLTLNANVSSSTFYVDLIQYRPNYELRETLHPTVFVDSTDPAVRYFEGSWQVFQNETMLTTDPGAKARVDFNGTRASWVGWVPATYPRGGSIGTYSVDGKEPVQFDIMGLPTDSNGTLYYQIFFETRILSRGSHSLEVVYEGPAAPLTLDYLIVDNGDIFVPSGSLPDVGGGGKGGSGGEDHGGVVPVDPQKSSASLPGTQAPVGAIVGGVIGGLIFIALVALLAFFLVKRKKDKAKSKIPPSTIENTPMSTGNTPTVFYPQNSFSTYGQNPYAVSNQPSMAFNANQSLGSNNVPTYHTQAMNPSSSTSWAAPNSSGQAYPTNVAQGYSNNVGYSSNPSPHLYTDKTAQPQSYPSGQQQQQHQGQASPPLSPTSTTHLSPNRYSTADNLSPNRYSTVDRSLSGRNSNLVGSDVSSTPDVNSFGMDGSDANPNPLLMR